MNTLASHNKKRRPALGNSHPQGAQFAYDGGHAPNALRSLGGAGHTAARSRQAMFVERFVILNTVGGECGDDFVHLRSDPWLAEFIAQELPSQDVARKFLNAFHEDGKIEEAQQRRLPDEIAYIPEENRALAGLGRVNRDLIHCLRGRCADQKIATVDPDATIIDCGKPETDVDCEDRVELDYKFFYTCNLSSKTEFPRKNGAFDGDFKVAACEVHRARL